MGVRQIKHDLLVHNLAIRLLEGGCVVMDGNVFRAKFLGNFNSEKPEVKTCFECNIDCLCKGLVAEVCTELDRFRVNQYVLELVY